jgi:hypothetical protein
MVANDFPAENIAPAIGGCVILFIALLFTVLQVVVFCKIYSRAGYSWAMGFKGSSGSSSRRLARPGRKTKIFEICDCRDEISHLCGNFNGQSL